MSVDCQLLSYYLSALNVSRWFHRLPRDAIQGLSQPRACLAALSVGCANRMLLPGTGDRRTCVMFYPCMPFVLVSRTPALFLLKSILLTRSLWITISMMTFAYMYTIHGDHIHPLPLRVPSHHFWFLSTSQLTPFTFMWFSPSELH